MKVQLCIEYPNEDFTQIIDITDLDWQVYQLGLLEFSKISDLSLRGANEWSLNLWTSKSA